MEIFIRVSGKTVKPMDKEHTLIPTEQNILDSGSTINNAAKDVKNGPMDKFTKVTI